MFVRGKYWYDLELKDEGRPFKDIEDHNRKEAAQSSGAELLDAFLYHNYQIGDLPGTTRLGRQVDSINRWMWRRSAGPVPRSRKG